MLPAIHTLRFVKKLSGANDTQRDKVPFEQKWMGRDLPVWLRILNFASLGFFAGLILVGIFTPSSLNYADMTLISLFLIFYYLAMNRYLDSKKKYTSLQFQEKQ
jgi:hypothetical protein